MVEIYYIFDPRKPEEVRYIGKTIVGLKKRMYKHLYNAKNGVNSPLYKWMGKIMKDGVIPQITLIEQVSEKIWVEKEIYWIQKFRNEIGNKLLNLTDGGESNLNWIPSKETREKISKSNKGKIGFFKGKKLSEEHKKNIKMGGTGLKRSEETKSNISKSLLGKKFADEHKINLSKAKKGKIAKNRREVYKICIKTNKILECYVSLEDAAIKNNIKNKGNIVSVCKGIRNHAGGFKWQYKN